MQKLKQARIGAGMIKGAIVSIIFLTVFLSILPSLIETSATSVHNLSDTFAGMTSIIGTNAATIGGNLDDWTGYFWVVGPLVLIIGLISAIFMRRR